MTYPYKAIPTKYKNVQFRSRLEARWAAFFDLLGWKWLYEPVDLAGYIPDFILNMPAGQVLVEVKPALLKEDLVKLGGDKVSRSGWDKEALIVGGCLFESEYWSDFDCVGMMREVGEDPTDWFWHEALIGMCNKCDKATFRSGVMSYHCRHNGCSNKEVMGQSYEPLWAKAGNLAQWRRK